jgi:preprotein translocase subunit YajC
VDTVAPFLILLGIGVLFWLAMIRPAQRRQQTMARMQGGVGVGDEVMLTSGIFGFVRSVDEKTMHLEVAEGVTVRVVRAAVGEVVTPVARDEGTGLEAGAAVEPEEKQD